MKKSTQIIATALFLLVGNFAFSQNDSMYVVNGGVVIGKYAISKVDSVIFYNPDSKTSSDTIDTEEASIVGEWLFTSIDVEVSTIVTKNGIVTEETDTNYTMDATDPDWEMSELEFTSDGFLLENGDTVGTYTYQDDLLILTSSEDEDDDNDDDEDDEDDEDEDDEDDDSFVCTVSSTNLSLIMEDTETNYEVVDGVEIIETITSKMTYHGIRK
jgi:hypothetical protein